MSDAPSSSAGLSTWRTSPAIRPSAPSSYYAPAPPSSPSISQPTQADRGPSPACVSNPAEALGSPPEPQVDRLGADEADDDDDMASDSEYGQDEEFEEVEEEVKSEKVKVKDEEKAAWEDDVYVPTRTAFALATEEYLSSLSDRKRPKALITQAMYDDVLTLLTAEPTDKIQVGTAQFRHWARKTFNVVETADDPVIVHEGRPVSVQEQIYDVLVHCHKQCLHGGRDKTTAAVRKYYSWIPKDLIARFVRVCPLCAKRKPGIKTELPPARKRQRLDLDAVAVKVEIANEGGFSSLPPLPAPPAPPVVVVEERQYPHARPYPRAHADAHEYDAHSVPMALTQSTSSSASVASWTNTDASGTSTVPAKYTYASPDSVKCHDEVKEEIMSSYDLSSGRPSIQVGPSSDIDASSRRPSIIYDYAPTPEYVSVPSSYDESASSSAYGADSRRPSMQAWTSDGGVSPPTSESSYTYPHAPVHVHTHVYAHAHPQLPLEHLSAEPEAYALEHRRYSEAAILAVQQNYPSQRHSLSTSQELPPRSSTGMGYAKPAAPRFESLRPYSALAQAYGEYSFPASSLAPYAAPPRGIQRINRPAPLGISTALNYAPDPSFARTPISPLYAYSHLPITPSIASAMSSLVVHTPTTATLSYSATAAPDDELPPSPTVSYGKRPIEMLTSPMGAPTAAYAPEPEHAYEDGSAGTPFPSPADENPHAYGKTVEFQKAFENVQAV